MIFLIVAAVGVNLVVQKSTNAAYPAEWDPRVLYAVEFIEDVNGAPFVHPVDVDFLSEADFVSSVTEPAAPVTDEDRVDADREVGRLRALGLVEGEVDLLAEQSTMLGSGTAAYYDSNIERVRVRGTSLDVAVKGTLVHELAHVWQDQYYDLDSLRSVPTQQESDAVRTVAEGDATNMEDSWVAELSDAEYDEYQALTDEASDAAVSGMQSVPDILIASFQGPYAFGPPFVRGLDAAEDGSMVEEAFTVPPVDDEQILEPWLYHAGAPTPRDVRDPGTGSGTEVERDSLGALFVYLMLAEHIDPHLALEASDAWAGDEYTLTDDGGRVCVRARIEGRDRAGSTVLQARFREWAVTLPHVTVTSDDVGVDIEACDPGAFADVRVAGRSTDVIGLPTIRLYAWAAQLEEGDSEVHARCYAEASAEAVTLADLQSSEMSDERFAQIDDTARAHCL